MYFYTFLINKNVIADHSVYQMYTLLFSQGGASVTPLSWYKEIYLQFGNQFGRCFGYTKLLSGPNLGKDELKILEILYLRIIKKKGKSCDESR